MFHTYRYTKVRGPFSNQYPSLSWEFYLEGDNLLFKFARCNPKDQFSYKKAREILSERGWYQVPYTSGKSLVGHVIDVFRVTPTMANERRIVRDYECIQRINENRLAAEHGVYQ